MRRLVFAFMPVCISISLAITPWSTSSVVCAQQPSLRYTGGWSTSERAPASTASQSNVPPTASQSFASSPVVQAAYYQGPGGGLPPFPGAGAPQNYGDAGVMQPALPPMPNALQNSQGFNDYSATNFGNNGPAPIPQNIPTQSQPLRNQPAVMPPQQPFDPYATQPNQVMPPASNPYRTVAAGDNLRAVQNGAQPIGNPSNDLRPVAPSMPTGFGPNSRPIDIATGYPFVSPAPRVGTYPTSSYNPSLFRTVSYKNFVQAPLQPGQINAVNPNVANLQPTLPQYQNAPVAAAPGVYPTQYQCAPSGTAVYPPPGAVPGTYIPPTITPNLAPGSYSPNNSGYSPLFSLGQENYNVQIGRGIIGQPTVYVPGQPFRNFFRYLSP